jgi:hypothetical protein
MTCLHTQHMEAIELLARKARSLSQELRSEHGDELAAVAAELEAMSIMATCGLYQRADLLQQAIERATRAAGGAA